MLQNRRLNLIAVTLVGLLLLGGCGVAPAPESHLSLTAPKTSRPVAKTVESFKVTVTNEADAAAEIDLSLDTVEGADWKAALCYEEFCFMHDGQTATHHTLPMAAGEARAFEIKFFVPESALSGESKIVKMAAAIAGSRAAGPSVELEGIVP